MAETLVPLSSIEDLNKQWLEEMLSCKRGCRVMITTWSVKVPEVKAGFMSEIGFVKVSFVPSEHAKSTECESGGKNKQIITANEKEECLSLVVKLMPKDPSSMELVKENDAGRREVEFYKYASSEEFRIFCLKSGVPQPVPEVYWAGLRDDAITVILPDLTSDGFSVVTPVEGNSIEQIICVLRFIAVIHVAGIAHISQHGRHIADIPFDYIYVYIDFIKSGLDIQIKMFEGTHTAATLSALLPHVRDLAGVAARYPLLDTLIHGDLWTGNVMFSKGNTCASIIDWQFSRIGNPVCDIVTLLFLSAESIAYQQHLPRLLDCYWQSFDEAVKKNKVSVSISLEQFSKNVDEMLIYGYMFTTLSLNDMINNNLISEARVKEMVIFMERKGYFAKFLSGK